MVTFWELLFVAWLCPGDAHGLRLVPEAARPLASVAGVCRQELRREVWLRREQAEARLREIGPGPTATLSWCRGLRCWPRKIVWKSVLEVSP